jgi:hypothetical protein
LDQLESERCRMKGRNRIEFIKSIFVHTQWSGHEEWKESRGARDRLFRTLSKRENKKIISLRGSCKKPATSRIPIIITHNQDWQLVLHVRKL